MMFDPSAAAQLDQVPWYADYDESLPVACDAADVLYWRDRLRRFFPERGVQLMGVASRVVFAEQFNQLLDEFHNKSTSLSQVTMSLARHVSSPLEEGSILIQCDKHGGRNRYGQLLQEAFPEHFVEVYDESRESSRYRFGPPARRHEVRFSARADRSCLPTALASMISKYLRELAMRAFNRFWLNHKSDLRPTAGYPQDARRFLSEIMPIKTRLKIPDRLLWRVR
jgi:ribonuclease HII